MYLQCRYIRCGKETVSRNFSKSSSILWSVIVLFSARHHTGTIQFMASDLVIEGLPVHLYRHDSELFFYILVWVAVHFDIKNKKRASTLAALKR